MIDESTSQIDLSLQQYILERDNYTTKIVYHFTVGSGGIGDYVKFFICVLKICIKYKYKLYCLVNGTDIEKYIKLKHENFYITYEEIVNSQIKHILLNSLGEITDDKYNIASPNIFYNISDINLFYINIKNVFYFSDEIISNSYKILPNIKNYISLHLRLGDKYLETEKSYVLCIEDQRKYDDEKIYEYIENNKDKNIVFFCDNNSYKLKLKERYNNIVITSGEIGHTSLKNTTSQQILDAVTEFYIITNSERVCCASYSGFSIIAAYFKNIPIIKLYE
jgi:hypothetical protein